MGRVIIARSHEFADGTIGRMLKAFQAQEDAKNRRQWITEQEEKLAAAKLNLFFINELAAEYDKRSIPTNRKEQ